MYLLNNKVSTVHLGLKKERKPRGVHPTNTHSSDGTDICDLQLMLILISILNINDMYHFSTSCF